MEHADTAQAFRLQFTLASLRSVLAPPDMTKSGEEPTTTIH